MEINLSRGVIYTVLDSLDSTKRHLEWQLNYGIPCGKVSFDRKEIIQIKLAYVNEAMHVFEELKEQMNNT